MIKPNIKYLLLCPFIILFVCFMYTTNISQKDYNVTYKRPRIYNIRESNRDRNVKILLWTKYFGETWKISKINTTFLLESKKCQIVNKKSELSSSDAVVFHWWDISMQRLPHVKKARQKWVLYNLEAPPVLKKYVFWSSLKTIEQRLDWNMTYTLGADIPIPYGVVNNCDTQWKLREDVFEKKNRSIAWIVSNCKTDSKREELVAMLKKYIDVDVFGRCGDHKCDKSDDSCYQMIEQNYKFYLSFENSVIIISHSCWPFR